MLGDECLSPDAETNDILSAATILLDRQGRIANLEERAASERDFDGSLSELRPPELLQMLHVRRASGRLTIVPTPADGVSPNGSILVCDGEIHSAFAGRAIAEKALFRMLDWNEGEFYFEPHEITAKPSILGPTRSVLAEGMRQLEESHRQSPRLPALDAPVSLAVPASDLPKSMHPLTQEVLEVLREAERVGDVVDRCVQPDFQILRTLHTLKERGLVAFGRAHLAPPDSTDATLFNEPQCRKLRSFAEQGQGGFAQPADCKLMLVAPDEDVARRFAELLAKVPGAEISPRLERGEIDRTDLETIARLDVDGDFGIDLVQLPSEVGFAPLWPFASHAALGTIFLSDVAACDAMDRVKPLADAVSKNEEARLFHVVLLDEGERPAPDALESNLPTVDASSLFLLPVDSDRDPGAVLRSLFARIIP